MRVYAPGTYRGVVGSVVDVGEHHVAIRRVDGGLTLLALGSILRVDVYGDPEAEAKRLLPPALAGDTRFERTRRNGGWEVRLRFTRKLTQQEWEEAGRALSSAGWRYIHRRPRGGGGDSGGYWAHDHPAFKGGGEG